MKKKDEFRGAVKGRAFDSLAAEYDVIVLEGAGQSGGNQFER